MNKQTEGLDSRFIYAEDFTRDGKYVDVTLTIEEVLPAGSVQYANGKPAPSSLRFDKTEKLYVLNKTNYRILKQMFGSKPSEWTGRKITLYPAKGKSFGEDVLWLRIRYPQDMPVRKNVKDQLGQDLTGKEVMG